MEMGHRVSGCDCSTSQETERLQQTGLDFYSPHSAVPVQDAEVVVYSSAIREDNTALHAAREMGKLCIRRAECLAAILNGEKGIVVAGAHGKTTTSSLTAHLLREGRMRPSHYVGAEIPVLGANAHWNEQSDYMVAEGDESDGTLVNYYPEYSIILNIEAEHLDFYRDLAHIKSVFAQLCRQTRSKIIYCKSDPGANEVCSVFPNSISYGWKDADYTADDVQIKSGRSVYTIKHCGEVLGQVELGIPGRHNVLNSLAAVALALELGCDFAAVVRGLASFAGARRRFETKYLSRNYRIVDDYGHHPTEIDATLSTALSLKPRRLVVLFQPHRYTRTQLLRNDFGRVLKDVDELFVTDVYPAGEVPIPGISGQTIVDAVREQGSTHVQYVPDVHGAHRVIGNILRPGDLFLTLGAGNVHEAGTCVARDLRLLAEMQQECGVDFPCCLYEPMVRHTTIGVGGRAQFWLEPNTAEATRAALGFFKDRNIPVYVVGRGSNLVVRDGGIRGAVIHPEGGEFEQLSVEGTRITAGVGVKLKKLASFAAAHGLSGFEWMEGIPGSVGGGLRMNAGSMGKDMWGIFYSAEALDKEGEPVHFEKANMQGAQYRVIPEFEHHTVLRATFNGVPTGRAVIEATMRGYHEKRRVTQPRQPSAGCTFMNPPDGPAAGKLISDLGLKGFSIGAAQVSTVHANFIINTGDASAADVTALIDHVRRRVKETYGFTLRTEVQVIGEREAEF